MKNLSKEATSPAAIAMSVEQWFDKYGVEILKRELAKQNPKAKAATASR
jgi:hypothetical protein